MKTTTRWIATVSIAACSMGVFAALAGSSAASSGASEPSAGAPSGATTASSSAEAAPPARPVIRGAEIPTERSEAPKAADWKDAKLVAPNRDLRDDNAFVRNRCSFRLIREWMRVSCTNAVTVTFIAGEPKGVKTWVSGTPLGWNEALQQSNMSLGTIDVPIVRGQSFIASIHYVESDYGGAMAVAGDTVHLAWREGMEDPQLFVTAPRSF
jgi:hypothetical protein